MVKVDDPPVVPSAASVQLVERLARYVLLAKQPGDGISEEILTLSGTGDNALPPDNEKMQKDFAEYMNDPVAQALFPQAIFIITLHHERRQFIINKTILGRLWLNMIILTDGKNPLASISFDNQKCDGDWKALCEAIQRDDLVPVLKAFSQILYAAVLDLVGMEFPPVPPVTYDFKGSLISRSQE